MKKLIAILVIASLFSYKKEEKRCLSCTTLQTVRHNGVLKSQQGPSTSTLCFTDESLEKYLKDNNRNEVTEYSPGVIQTFVRTATCK